MAHTYTDRLGHSCDPKTSPRLFWSQVMLCKQYNSYTQKEPTLKGGKLPIRPMKDYQGLLESILASISAFLREPP